ncbi:uncharacterized protein BJ171DRAFT_596946 [Polychytrium aggregatum]|uniref:uncharacterized protein n=1 Tax=Polychytrium aggregatum TaxID=110093 RepID=UPI0022FF1097|nr:uncharacterized protein BJ171DRAFT_596946 [Polychytrium aggregatum]KAI9207413.1 hypothetical protein BJ171DRAFT_596946 [Polychytrium aggregatum]
MVAANMPTVEVIEHHVISPYPSQPYSGPRREIVLLILGETGVGKSTFINALPNYLLFNSIDEIREDRIINLIPTSFYVFEPGALTDGKLIESGQLSFRSNAAVHFDSDSAWKNEVRGQGQSSTQSPHTYVLDTELSNGEPVTVKFIDTPGMGDTRGVEQDKKNMDNIIQYIANYEKIHGILILLKPNQSRLTTFFRFCVMELLRSLHRECVKNMVFLFTNAQSTNFRPGDTMDSLLPLIEQISKDSRVSIFLRNENMFMIDNEAYRYLLAKNKVKFEEEEERKFLISWEMSSSACRKLLDVVSSLTPHETQQTTTLYLVRDKVLELCKPLGDVAAMIVTNQSNIENKIMTLQTAANSVKDLDKILNIKVNTPVKREIDRPTTVCTNPGCVRYIQDEFGNNLTHYITRCHKPCYLKRVPVQTIGDPQLALCAQMQNDHCVRCTHSFREHMHIKWELVFQKKSVIDPNIKDQIAQQKDRQSKVQATIKELKSYQKQLVKEQKRIMKISAKFSAFVKNNGIVLYNDAMLDYLDHLIKDARESFGGDVGAREEKIKGLEELKAIYVTERKVLSEGIRMKMFFAPSVNDIKKLMDELVNMEFSGQFFKSFDLPTDYTEENGIGSQERTVKPQPLNDGSLVGAAGTAQAQLPTPAIRPPAPYTPIYDKPRVGVKEFFSKFKFSRS